MEYEHFFQDKAENPETPRKKPKPYTVLYQDDRIVVFDKSAGISSIPERYIRGVSLKEIAEEQLGRLWTVHRIDKETSGVIVFARDGAAHKSLNDQFEARTAWKLYAAVTMGELPQDQMSVDIPIGADPSAPGKMRPSASGKQCLTIIRVRERFRGFTYIEAELITGRTHQIRVHCKAIGYPLLADPLYGQGGELFLSQIKRRYKDYGRPEKPLMAHTALHAESLRIVHPGTGQEMTFKAPHPKDFRALLMQLRKVAAVR